MCGRMFLLMCVIVVFGLGSGLKAGTVTYSGESVTEDLNISDNGGNTWSASDSAGTLIMANPAVSGWTAVSYI